MAAKSKSHPLNGAHHTAGIFAAMSVDGPEIGTLVVIVDRAKNLPNRKTIGKQDPYCAARLGKEAKKTKTDVRGGQTPKWDQELRFTVHDCPDYYQLKLSIFTDDKRTDLIGESWIDLKGIIVAGGGQNDMWQNLTCRGKYAGEIRVEITYYDVRPKLDKPTPTPRPRAQPSASDLDAGSTRQRTPVKRRPLPSDPVTGEAPVTPPAAQAVPPQPRGSSVSEQYQTPQRVHARHQSHAGYVPNSSPLQSVEYGTPPSGYRQSQTEHYSPSSMSQHQTPPRMDPQRQPARSIDPFDGSPRPLGDREYSPGPLMAQAEPRGLPRREHHEFHMGEDQLQFSPTVEDERPPPPPAHRTRQSIGGPDAGYRNNFESPPQKSNAPLSMRHDVLKHEAHRYSMPAQSGRPAIRGYDSAPPAMNSMPPQERLEYDTGLPRQHSYDPSYDPHHRSMQPTVEDVPDSPTGHYPDTYGYGGSPVGRDDEPFQGYEPSASPAPLNLRTTPRNSPSPRPGPAMEDVHGGGYQSQNSTYAGREYSTSPGHELVRVNPRRSQSHFDMADDWQAHGSSSSHFAHDLPPSLVPGMDPNVSREISDRIQEERNQDRRYSSQGAMVVATRGRHMSEPPPSYGHGQPGQSYSFTSQPTERRSEVTYSSGNEMALTRARDVSPIPPASSEHRIRRKSVSPAPPPAEERRSMEVPFGPDSFNAFNSNLPSTQSDSPIVDPDAPIITHDGKEVDPSDHLPIESWAPEPDPKPKQPSPDHRSRPSPNGAQPMPSSGRRLIRITARPQQAPAPGHPSFGPQEPLTPPSAITPGRNRLQKKANRASIAYLPSGSSPLAPISPDNFQDRQQYTPTQSAQRSPHRMSHYDYPNENYAPRQGSAPPIPAKVPLPVMSGAATGPDSMALVHEMQTIDIGTGRSRRRGGY